MRRVCGRYEGGESGRDGMEECFGLEAYAVAASHDWMAVTVNDWEAPPARRSTPPRRRLISHFAKHVDPANDTSHTSLNL